MTYTLVGLGNPGEEYELTRHNTGRIVLEAALKPFDFPEFEFHKKYNALVAEGKIAKEKVIALEPETFMNKSGLSVAPFITSEKKAAMLVVFHDDLDLPIGTVKVNFNRGSGGHRGVESIIKSIKTEKFLRVRIGISPKKASGKINKPKSEKVGDFILKEFKKEDLAELKKIGKKISAMLPVLIEEGMLKAMSVYNN